MRRVHEQSRCAGALARRFVDSVLGSACSGWCGCRMSVWAGCFDFAGLNLPGGISCLGGGGGRRWGMCIWIGAVAKFQHWLAILSGGLLLCGGWGSGLCYWVLRVRVGLWLFAGWFCIIILCSFYIFLNFLGFPSLKLFDNW